MDGSPSIETIPKVTPQFKMQSRAGPATSKHAPRTLLAHSLIIHCCSTLSGSRARGLQFLGMRYYMQARTLRQPWPGSCFCWYWLSAKSAKSVSKSPSLDLGFIITGNEDAMQTHVVQRFATFVALPGYNDVIKRSSFVGGVLTWFSIPHSPIHEWSSHE